VSRRLNQLAYFGRAAARGLRGSPVTTAVAVVTIGMALVLVGAFDLLLRNMEELIDGFSEDLQVTAYLEDELGEADRARLEETVRTIEGVERVRFVSKSEALERFEAGVGAGSGLLEGLDENPLPASLEIVLVPARRSPEGMRVVEESLRGLPGVADLSSGQDWVAGYLRAIAIVRGTGIGLSAILAVAALLIVTNTIRLAVVARRDELDILWLVGGSRAFMNTPFLVEGLLQGAIGGGVAVTLLYGIFLAVLPGFEVAFELVLGGAPRFFSLGEALTLIAQGAGLGLLGSAAAVAGSART